MRTGDSIRCHCHGAIFNLDSGAVECSPATNPLRKFQVRVGDDEIISVNLGDTPQHENSTDLTTDHSCKNVPLILFLNFHQKFESIEYLKYFKIYCKFHVHISCKS